MNNTSIFFVMEDVMEQKKLILIEIEKCRKEMNDLSKHLDLSSDEVVSISRQLDKLLNQFEKAR
ncbi:Spo0E family sporulation regulatory protein-aspartic acid phosphatase [Thalassobacillus cyri]